MRTLGNDLHTDIREVEARKGYPDEFVRALTQAGWLAARIRPEFGGSGLGIAEASAIMEEISSSGGNAGACHGQMYNMQTVLKHGSHEQKARWLPKICTFTERQGDRYVVNGQKVWISRVRHSDLMNLLARTTPLADVRKKVDGLSIIMVDLREAIGASREAANACLQFHGGFGFAKECGVERKFRETRLYQVAPISTNLILSHLAEHVLGLPRSF